MLQQKSRLASARPRGVEDQPRPAQPAGLGAIVLRPAGAARRPAGAALRAETDARARARHRLLPVDAVLRRARRSRRPTARIVALEPLVEEVRETLGLMPEAPIGWISAIERGLKVDADHDQLLRVLLNLARNADAGAGNARAERSRARPDPRHRPARGRGGGDRGVRHRPRPVRTRRAAICSRRSRARPAPAAPGSGWSSPPNWSGRMAATSGWSTAPSGRPSASPSPTARWNSTPSAPNARAPDLTSHRLEPPRGDGPRDDASPGGLARCPHGGLVRPNGGFVWPKYRTLVVEYIPIPPCPAGGRSAPRRRPAGRSSSFRREVPRPTRGCPAARRQALPSRDQDVSYAPVRSARDHAGESDMRP